MNSYISQEEIPNNTRYIFVLGGVISGLGKGVTSGSIAAILKEMGYNKNRQPERLQENRLYSSLYPSVKNITFRDYLI